MAAADQRIWCPTIISNTTNKENTKNEVKVQKLALSATFYFSYDVDLKKATKNSYDMNVSENFNFFVRNRKMVLLYIASASSAQHVLGQATRDHRFCDLVANVIIKSPIGVRVSARRMTAQIVSLTSSTTTSTTVKMESSCDNISTTVESVVALPRSLFLLRNSRAAVKFWASCRTFIGMRTQRCLSTQILDVHRNARLRCALFERKTRAPTH